MWSLANQCIGVSMQCAMTFVKLCTSLYKNQAVHKWIYFTHNFLNEFYNKFTFISLALLFSAVFCITVFFLLLTLFVKPDKFPRLWHKIATTMLHQWRLRKPLYDDYSSSRQQQQAAASYTNRHNNLLRKSWRKRYRR